jgi:hypothetical protein
MDARSPKNATMTEPRVAEPAPVSVNHILSYDEQRSLSREQIDEYFNWLMARPVKRKMTDEQYLQKDYAKDFGSDFNYETGE